MRSVVEKPKHRVTIGVQAKTMESYLCKYFLARQVQMEYDISCLSSMTVTTYNKGNHLSKTIFFLKRLLPHFRECASIDRSASQGRQAACNEDVLKMKMHCRRKPILK